MKDKVAHTQFISEKGTFRPSCSNHIFSYDEWDTLCKFGYWFKALEEGTLQPFTPEQEHFVKAAKGEVNPESYHEQIWYKYKKRKEIEAKYGSSLHHVPRAEQDTFHNREGHKKISRMLFGKKRK